MTYLRSDKVKFLCWDDDNCTEEDATRVIEAHPDNYGEVAHDFAEERYHKDPTDWGDVVVIKVKDQSIGHTYTFQISTEYEPVFHCSLKKESDEQRSNG